MKADTLRPELKEKIVEWLISFHRLDPRYKILTFFNQVASDGADKFTEDDEEEEYGPSIPKRQLTHIEKLLSDAFNTTSILTVWRPTSNEAMKKMMDKTGVGKGLDIKGKSAKRGMLSAFVPFMQIHEQDDKQKVQKISRKAKMRIYYQSLEAREAVMDELEPLGNDYMVFDPELVIPSDMEELDQYVKTQKLYGLEVPQRLFWLGCVLNQDITRASDTDTGRPSTPGFQDANMKTLKVACADHAKGKKPSPMPVVYQYDPKPDNALKPQTLVMAYEENGSVTPVVSDFDGFLLGWRREALWFGCQLPRDQEDLMLWCVDNIEKILDSKQTTDTWTVRWLEVLKEEAEKMGNMVIPEYGFGDPKSYGIMERAAMQLIDTGAVRHGSECFNYYFPQEIDDYFLLISDTLKPVPWKYVNVEELQAILSQRVKDGFVFPLNPKWILCDPGWKELYDELMASDALYAEYTKDVWYPPFSGVREKIDLIHKKHPNGFQRQRGRASFIASQQGYSPLRQNLEDGNQLSGNAAFDLAELELQNFTSRKNALAAQIQLASLNELPGGGGDTGDSSDDDDDQETAAQSILAGGLLQQQAADSTAAQPGPRNGGMQSGHESISNMVADVTNDPADKRREFRRAALTASQTGHAPMR
ncbi:expressed unknown protein [Seminavis robusta]|uniref:Uncharacterized protein n=1 Tax=Seminavis robusta TaxID=568900 RepID=A0A9N8DKJ9_9STRA|nr:expressed unknown protein [Seminavis robusta]|eukprot:Sro136_g064040.1 n/a (646) ;mRNA; f:34756-36693